MTDTASLIARQWDGYGCIACKGTGENLSNPGDAGQCEECRGTGSAPRRSDGEALHEKFDGNGRDRKNGGFCS